MVTESKPRVLPIRRKVKQLDWFLAWMTRVMPCAICGESLAEGYNKREPGQSITLHHTEGSREEDRWDDPDYVTKMVPCHKTCHRSYHLSKQHMENGKNVDRAKLAWMERNIRNTVRQQQERLGL